MEQISVFDIFKVGIGPSSSHTMGPWKAAHRAIMHIKALRPLHDVATLTIELYGSLAKTGRGHGTGMAILLGLSGEDPVTIDVDLVRPTVANIRKNKILVLGGEIPLVFDPATNIQFLYNKVLPFHSNGMKFIFSMKDGGGGEELTYYSVGGGFIVREGEPPETLEEKVKYPATSAAELLNWCIESNRSIAQVVMDNECCWKTEMEVKKGLLNIWQVMKDCVYRGCHTDGELPGGLQVSRRAAALYKKLMPDGIYNNQEEWLALVKTTDPAFSRILKWVSCFALAVNEENAAFGRVVTAPTNGAAGVIPAVLHYMWCFCDNITEQEVIDFLLTAGQLGAIFKNGSTISAAMGGCQAEIGVSSAMAAGGLTACMGGTPQQVLMATEIAMEHHLGLTCDPIGGLVQVPCIERNTMGAIKAITASQIALESDPLKAKVTLDDVIKTMWETALDMNAKYKETSEGGLALRVPVNVVEC